MTLLQRERENIELGLKEGRDQAARIIKLYIRGCSYEEIADALHLDLATVKSTIDEYENDD